jgi:cytochrome c oxidase assembly protein subunit 15
VPHQAQGQVHVWIEFGNRLLTFALILVSISVLVVVIATKRKDIRALAIGQLAGIFAQIPLGGITVLTHLNPIPVAFHFLLSIVLIAAGTTLFSRRKPNHTTSVRVPRRVEILGRIHISLVAIVIIVGTLVTGSGPNAGDASAPRFHLHLDSIAWIHAWLAIALLIVSIIMYGYALAQMRKRIAIFGVALLVQGAIGFIQYYQGLPQIIVGAHLFGVVIVWISAWRIHLVTHKVTQPRSRGI